MKRLLFLSVLLLALGATPAHAEYIIANPYQDVDWAQWGQYKASLHAHTTLSDGYATLEQVVEDHRAKGYDILAITDHSSFATWMPDNAPGKTDMIGISYANEQSMANHVNTFWTDFRGEKGPTADVLAGVERTGGISFLAHPGQYTESYKRISHNSRGTEDAAGIKASRNHRYIPKYINHFKTNLSCVGMEIINSLDWVSAADRVLWDALLSRTMPERPIWGFACDDSHWLDAIGYAWNVMLMPELTQKATRISMEAGAFYAVSRVSRLDFINRTMDNNEKQTYVPEMGTSSTLFLLEQATPGISHIEVGDASITITGHDYTTIEWIANGELIAFGETFVLGDHEGEITYVRAQLKSDTGIAFTQPFGIIKVGD